MDQGQLSKLSLVAGDILVVKARGKLSAPAAARYRKAARLEVPEGVGVLVVDDSVRVAALTSAEIEARTG